MTEQEGLRELQKEYQLIRSSAAAQERKEALEFGMTPLEYHQWKNADLELMSEEEMDATLPEVEIDL